MLFEFALLNGMNSFGADVVIFHNTTDAEDSNRERQKVKPPVINVSCDSDAL